MTYKPRLIIKPIFLILLLLNTVYGLEELVYEGLRVDLSALTLNRDIVSSIKPALNRTLNHTFTNLYQGGFLGSILKLSEIKITKPVINEDRLDMVQLNFERPIYTLKGTFGCILFHLSFQYSLTWLGIPLTSGHGTGVVNNMAEKILVFFNESDPDVQLPHPWDVTNITIPWSIFNPASSIESLLESRFINEFHRIVDESMNDFAHNLLHTYRYIEDMFENNIDLIFRNDIINVKPTVGNTYLSIGFDTNMSVNKILKKKIFRRITGTVSPAGDIDFCLAAQLVPDTMDILGKGGYYNIATLPKDFGFNNNTLWCLFEIVPGISKRYSGDDTFSIDCETSTSETVNDVTQRHSSSPVLELQNPYYCHFKVDYNGDYVLQSNIIMRFYYHMNETNEGFGAYVDYVHLLAVKTHPILPVSKHEIFMEKARIFSTKFQNKDLLSPGIKVVPNRRNELTYLRALIKSDEICFSYTENRPETPSVK